MLNIYNYRNDDSLPGNDTWLMCFRILFDRNVYNNDGSSPARSQCTIGTNTAATLTDGCSLIVVCFEANFIFSIHLIRFSSLHKASTVNSPGESLNFRFTFEINVRVVNILSTNRLSISKFETFVYFLSKKMCAFVCLDDDDFSLMAIQPYDPFI